MTRFAWLAAAVVPLAACASTIPKAEIDRCNLGVADGNESFQTPQGAACGMVAQRLMADEKPSNAVGYARKSCELEDARGCEQYLALVRGQPSLQRDELVRARAAGEKACSGIVVGAAGTDARPGLCAHTAELYQDVEPRSTGDAGRLFARACKLGDTKSCARAKSLGVDMDEHPLIVTPKGKGKATGKASASATATPGATATSTPTPTATSTSTSTPTPTATQTMAPAIACHEMRQCVELDVQQRNTNEVVGTIANHCDRSVACTWCPAKGDQIDRAACRSATLGQNESKAGREGGLWFDGFTAIAYDCTDVSDNKGCLAL